MTNPSNPKFKEIDDVLAEYYNQLNVPNYRDLNDIGLFLKYIKAEELDDPALPIDQELGDNCNPYDCAYTWMNYDNPFPIPSYAQIPHQEKEAFIFYIMQYCYKHNQSPSHQYIQTVLIPKCNGTVNNALLPLTNNDQKENAPVAFSGDLLTKKEIKSNYMGCDDDENEGQSVNKKTACPTEQTFKPKCLQDILNIIDAGLEEYFKRYGLSYHHEFIQYIDNEGLNNQESIQDAFGYLSDDSNNCEPTDCAFSWFIYSHSFPIPSNYSNSKIRPAAFFFYIIKYCYKFYKPPSNKYIKEHIITNPKVLIANAPAFIPNKNNKLSVIAEELPIKRISKEEFKPKYPARAHLNIFISKELTKQLRGNIAEKFENDLILYYYMDISTALQINDKQMKEFKVLNIKLDDNEQILGIINYDLHSKLQKHDLYGIIVPNNNYKIQKDKWLWKLDEFLIADQIYEKYKIKKEELPLSSRQMLTFKKQLSQQLVIEESLIDETDWFNVLQIKSLKRNVKIPKVIITLTKEMWINECKKSFSNVNLPLIPVVINKHNNHWIEWIKIVHIESQNVYIGISCKFENNKWSVQSMCLDRGDIYNKHRLVGLTLDEYDCQLADFKTSITEVQFSDNDSKEVDKKMNVLKQQIRSQQDSIVRLKESLLRAKNANKYGNVHHNEKKEWNGQKIMEFMNGYGSDNECDVGKGDNWLNAIVDVLIFKTSPIGAKRNIYIDKQFTRLWMEHITPRFSDEAMMYYWLDYTTAIQMCQGYSKQYVKKINRKFMVAIVNYELKDKNGNILYGIIICNDECDNKNNDKYRYKYKLNALMTKEQIKREYGINKYDLPKKSRKCKAFMDKLVLKRKIRKSDLNKINWNNLKLFKSQSTHNDPINKSVTITQKVMKEYCNISLERLNVCNNNRNNNNLIPIVVIDKHSNYYGIEWILIVNIIHRNCDVGISFKYDEKLDVFIATAMYLDKGEIHAKHKLIGLTFDYCKHLRPFSLRKFKFKSDRHSIIDDDDDDISIHNNNNNYNKQIQLQQQQLIKYKKAFEREQTKVYQLQSQMQNTQNMYANLKYQSDQYVLAQQMVNYQYGGPRFDNQTNNYTQTR